MSKTSGFVILHYGAMTPDAMSKAARLVGETAVIGTDAARMAGASFAFGTPELLEGLQDRLAPGAVAAERARHRGISEAAIRWLAAGERGLSSDAVFSRLSGVETGCGEMAGHPHDPDDLRRCRLLLEQVPEFEGRIGEMAEVSPQWARLAEAWDGICATMDAEAPEWRSRGGRTPRTYEMMKTVLERKAA